MNCGLHMPMNDTIEKSGIFAIRVKIATLTYRSSENRKNFEKVKQTCSSTISMLYYC